MSTKTCHSFSGRRVLMFKFFILLVNFSFNVSAPLPTLPIPPFDQFISDAARNNCHLPKAIEPFNGPTKDWDFLSLPLKGCRDLNAAFETSELCHEIFDNLKVISCNPKSGVVMPRVHFELSKDVCKDFANFPYEIPKNETSVGGRLTDSFVCKIACAKNYEIMCKVLLWTYQVRHRMEDALKYPVAQVNELETDIVDGASMNVVVDDKRLEEQLLKTPIAPIKTYVKIKEDEHKENRNLNHDPKSKQDEKPNDQLTYPQVENSKKMQNVLPTTKSVIPDKALTAQIATENQSLSNKNMGQEINLSTQLPGSTSNKVNKEHAIKDEKSILPNIVVKTTVKDSKDLKSNDLKENFNSENLDEKTLLPNIVAKTTVKDSKDSKSNYFKGNFNSENLNDSTKFSDVSPEHLGDKDNSLSEGNKVKVTLDMEKNIKNENEEQNEKEEQNENAAEQNIEKEKGTSKDVTKSENKDHVTKQKDDNIVIPSNEFKNVIDNIGENRSTHQFKSTSLSIPEDKQNPVTQETVKNDKSKAYGDQNISVPNKVTKNAFATSVGYEIQTSSDVTLTPDVLEPKIEKMDDTNEIPPPVQQEQENDLENEGDLQGDYERPDYAPDGLLNTPTITKTANSVNIIATSEKTFENSMNDEKIDMSHLYDDLVPRNPGLNTEDFHRTPFPEEDDSHFFFYFLSIVFILMTGYLLFHNKQKIIALIVEGRHERRRRSHGAGYKKLENK